MSKNLLFLLSFLLSYPLDFSKAGGYSPYDPSICVIDFTKPHETNSLVVEGLFEHEERVSYHKGATPEDLTNCLLGDFHEVLIVAHAYSYTRHSPVVSISNPISSKTNARITYWDPEKEKFSALSKNFFTEIQKNFPKHTSSLKSLRILTCYSSVLVEQYKLRSFSRELNIHLDISPTIIWSFMPYTWIVESLQIMEDNVEEDYTFLIPLSTIVLLNTGGRVVLGGKYKIEIIGASLGLGKLWIPVNLPKRDLESMSVGETRTYNRGMGFSFGWIGDDFSTYQPEFMKEEIQYYKNYIKSKSVNLGISLDIISELKVTKLR